MFVWLDAPTSLFSLSQTSSDIRFGERNPALSHRNEYLARLIISQLEQVVTQWNAILFQLVYGWTIHTPVCLLLYIKLQLEEQAQWSLIKETSNFRYKLWENHDLTVQQVITNIYLCERAMVRNLFT